MAYSIIIFFDGLRSIAAASIGSSYTAIGTPLLHPSRIIKIQNLTDSDVLISYDGVNDNDFVPSGGFTLYDISTNQVQTDGAFLLKGTTIYVKESGSPTTGSVYVTIGYGRGD